MQHSVLCSFSNKVTVLYIYVADYKQNSKKKKKNSILAELLNIFYKVENVRKKS